MPSMRRLIDLSEANAKPSAPAAFDTTTLLSGFKALAVALAGPPYDVTWRREWTDLLLAHTQKRAVEHRLRADRDGETVTFQPRHFIAADAARLWQRESGVLLRVKPEVAQLEHDYQMQRRQSHYGDRPDWATNPYYGIESSDYLTGMTAQIRAAAAMQAFRPDEPSSYQPLLEALRTLLGVWDGLHDQHDLVLVEPLQAVLGNLLPFVLMLLQHAF